MRTTVQLFVVLLCYLNGMSQTANVTGRVYFDNNRNSILDSGDSTYNQLSVVAHTTDYSSFYDISTNSEGIYSIVLPLGDWEISANNFNRYIYENGSIILQFSNISSDTSQIADIIISKRPDIQYAAVYFGNSFTDPWLPIATPSGQNYIFGCNYSGGATSINGVLSLDYNPLLTFVSASSTPISKSKGHLEWARYSIKNGVDDTIGMRFQYPLTGDTILGVYFNFSFKPILAGVDTVYKGVYQQQIVQPEAKPIGPSKGVKWNRTFFDEGSNPENFGNGIDTAIGGKEYFVVGEKYSEEYGALSNFVAKLDNAGLTVWESALDQWAEGENGVAGYTVTNTKDGGCLVSGVINYPGPWDGENYGNDDIIVFKLDMNGKLQWKNTFGGLKSEAALTYLIAVTVLPDGGYLLSSDTKSTDGIFANKNADTTHSNIFVVKLSATGNVVWSKLYGGSRDDMAIRIVPLQNGTFLLLGATESNDGDVVGAHQHSIQYVGTKYIDGQSYPDTVYNSEAWVLNIDSDGIIIWNKCYGGTQESFIAGAAENNGGILLTGFTNSKNGDLPLYDSKAVGLWMLQVSTSGQILWSKIIPQYKGYNTDGNTQSNDYYETGIFISNLRKKKDGSFVVAGATKDKYGELQAAHGGKDVVLVNIDPLGNILWQKAIGGTKDEDLTDIIVDRDDNILYVGNTESDNDDFYQHLEENGMLMAAGKVGITDIIKGQVYIDLNGNHLKEANETYNNEGRIYSAKQNDTTIARIFGGQFLNNVDTGNYVTTYVPANSYFTVFPASKNSAFTSFDQSDSVDFALVPKPNIKDFQTVITPLTPARPGFESSYRIITKNVGTTSIVNAVISLKKDSRQTYTSASRPNTGIAADSVWWGPFAINAFTNDTLDVVLTQAVPPTLQNGDTLNLTLYALPLANDTTPANNKASLRQIVQGSFDPNDKTEAHAGIYTPTMKASNEPFQYLIRFQNTGTDTAFYVTVKDTLDAKVDVNSLETITASHPYKFTLEGRVATWQFNKILLVDSTTNEPASHGYIAFTIKPSAGLKLGDSVINKAAIYFDFNLPVITNKSLLLLVSDKSVICPGGSTQFQAGQAGIAYQWQINTGNGYANLANGGIYSGATTQTLLVSNAPSSLYGTQYRCAVTLQGGSKVNGETYKLTFSNTWTGTASIAWENGTNWSCGTVPDENTDVIIKAGMPNTPTVSLATAVRSISASTGAKVMVKSGVVVTIKGK